MIKKLLVLNGTDGHKFEVGKQYVNTDDVQIVKEIESNALGYIVTFENNEYVIVETPHVLVFYSE